MTGGSREGVGGIPPLVYHVSYDAREKESDQSSAMYVKRAAMTHERKEGDQSSAMYVKGDANNVRR